MLLTRNSVGKKDLAKICGVRPSAVTKWVTGGGIDAINIAKIAIHFSVTTDWILGVTDRANPHAHANLNTSNYSPMNNLTPIKNLKILKLRKDAAAVKTALQQGMKAMSRLEKRLGEMDEN